MGLETYLQYPANAQSRGEMRNDKIAAAQILLRLAQSQYKQVSTCQTTSEIWRKLRQAYDETTDSKSSNLFIQLIHLQKKW